MESQDTSKMATTVLFAAVETNLVVVASTVGLVAVDTHNTFRGRAAGTISKVIVESIPRHTSGGLFALYTKWVADMTIVSN